MELKSLMLVSRTNSRVPSVEPQSELTNTAFRSGKYLARPAWTALTTWGMVRALLQLGMPTRISACPTSSIHFLIFWHRVALSMVPSKSTDAGIVLIDRFFDRLKYARNCRHGPVPACHQRAAVRVVHERLDRFTYASGKSLDGQALQVPVEEEAVDRGIVLELLEHVLGGPHIRRHQRLAHPLGKDDPFGSQGPENRFADVDAHLVQPLRLVLGRERLVLVLVVFGNIDLADPAGRRIPVDLGEDPDLQPPVAGNPVYPGEPQVHGTFPGQGVPEAVEEQQQGVVADDFLQRPDQGGNEEPGNPAVETVGHPAVIALAKIVIEVRVGHRVAEPCQEVPAVGKYVAVVDCDGVKILPGKDIAERHPDTPPLPFLSGDKARFPDGVVHPIDPFARVPDEVRPLRQNGKILLRLFKLFRRSGTEGYHDLLDVFNLFQVPDDPLQRLARKLAVERREDEGDRSPCRVPAKFILNFFGVTFTETVK